MNSRSESEPAEPLPSTPPEAEGSTRRERPSALTLLLVSLWVGLTAGFLDLGFTILKKHLIDGEDFYRLGEGFPWIIPAGVAGLVLLPGAVLALVARLRGCGAASRACGGAPLVRGGPRPLCPPAARSLGLGPPVGGGRGPGGPPGQAAAERIPPAGPPDVPGARRGGRDPRRGDLRRPRLVRASGGGHAAASAPRGSQRPADRLGHGPRQEPESLRPRPQDDAQPRAAGRPRRPVPACVRDGPLDPALAREPLHGQVAARALGRLEDRARRLSTHASPRA